jgi:hypothetical protein
MSSIYLKGDKLKYWIEDSDLIQMLATNKVFYKKVLNLEIAQ